MFKIEIRNPEKKLLAYEFQPIDYPLINLSFKNEGLKSKVLFWKRDTNHSDRSLSNKYLIDITLSESSFHKIAAETPLKTEMEFFSGYQKDQLPLNIRIIIADILQCACHPKFKKLYLKTKISELLIQILSDVPAETAESRWTEKELATFKQLKELISQDLKNNYAIDDLAQIAGMNRTKMQAGFKDLFGKTIYAYILDLKMMEAKTLLSREPQVSLKEIASLMGYKHTNHFSTAFKKKFTFSPSFFKKGINIMGSLFFAFN